MVKLELVSNMMKHKVKYRVVGTDRSKRKYSINLDEGTSFQLTWELLQGVSAREGSKPLCSFSIQNNILWIKAGADQNDVVLNGKPCREADVRPGDLVQVGEFSIELLECPHTIRNETNATQFLDVSEMFAAANSSSATSTSSQASTSSISSVQNDSQPHSQAAQEEPAPATPSHTAHEATQAMRIEDFQNQSSSPSAGTTSFDDIPPAPEASGKIEAAKDKWSSSRWESNESETNSQTRIPSTSAAARNRVSNEDSHSGLTQDSMHRPSSSVSRNRASSSPRDGERHGIGAARHSKRMEESTRRRHTEVHEAIGTEKEFSHLAMSAGMAALGVAATTRVLISSSPAPQGMIVACAALSSIPVTLGMSWGLTRLNEFLSTNSPMRDYARFLGWAMICAIPWAYTQSASFPIAVFTTLLTTVLISVGFVARFRPNMAHFSGVGAGFSAVALAALILYHQHAAKLASPDDSSLNGNAPITADNSTNSANTTAANTTTNAPAPGASTAPVNNAAPVAQASSTASDLQPPQVANNAAPQVAPQGNSLPPSSVTDTIPPIPNHADTSLAGANNPPNRAPAAIDPSAKGIIDPLAHEEFFSAIRMGNLEVVKSLIDRKQVDPDFTLDKGSTPLIVASASGRIKVVEYLLRRRVNINAQDPHGTTALMWAVFKGHRDVAKYLIAKGADTKVIRDDGDTALDIARKWRQTEIATLLKESAAQQDDTGFGQKSRSSRRKRSR
jgi:hypothetical protein